MREAADVPGRTTHFCAQYPHADPQMVEGVVRAVLTSLRGNASQVETALLSQVEELAQTLSAARAEIAALNAGAITGNHIPSATDELDAIIAHTAVATDIILECCERLDMLRPSLAGEAAQVVQDITTQIYEACGFQDITGQRITKVVATLQSIERKVAHIIAAFGHPPKAGARAGAMTPSSASSLNGPQLPGMAMDQSTIDALLASLQ